MYRSIMVGYDGSDHAKDALALARKICDAEGAKLIVAHAVPWDPWGAVDARPTHDADDLRREVASIVDEWSADAHEIRTNSPARGLSDLAEQLGVDLVVVGSSHRGPMGRAFAGSVARGLLHGAPCAIAVAPSRYRYTGELARIGVALDGGPEARHALEAAIELAELVGADVRVIGVVDPVGYSNAWGFGYVVDYSAIRAQLQEVLDDAVAAIPAAHHPESVILQGHAATAIAHAAEDLDALFIGSRAYGPVLRVLLGSVSSELVESAPCAVLVTPRGTESEPVDDRVETAAESA
jgi:nucleotide-binding universal stress UspA family protein